jgi:hypothetical protein
LFRLLFLLVIFFFFFFINIFSLLLSSCTRALANAQIGVCVTRDLGRRGRTWVCGTDVDRG